MTVLLHHSDLSGVALAETEGLKEEVKENDRSEDDRGIDDLRKEWISSYL